MGVTLIGTKIPVVKIVCLPIGGRLCFTNRRVNTCGLSNVAALRSSTALSGLMTTSMQLPRSLRQSQFMMITSHSRLAPRARTCVSTIGRGRGRIRLVSDNDSVGVYLITRNGTSICPHFTPAVR